MIELSGVTKRYRGIPSVEGVSFGIRPGEILGYLGPNGAGKSTTVKMITGLVEPSAGKIRFRGVDIHDDLAAYRRQIGYVPEEAQVYTHLSGMEYLQLVGRLRNMDEALLQKKAHSLLALFGLQDAQHSPMSEYSKGMKQRVLLSSALLHNPDFLIFDEPLSGLDAVSARLFKDMLVLLATEGKAILYISHGLEVVEQVCDRVIILNKGKVLADAPPSELTRLMKLPNLEDVFAQMVRQTDIRSIARDLVDAMKETHA